jgi:hypothetical protein
MMEIMKLMKMMLFLLSLPDDDDNDNGEYVVSFCVCAACRGQLELVHGSFLAIVVADSTTWNLGIQTQP